MSILGRDRATFSRFSAPGRVKRKTARPACRAFGKVVAQFGQQRATKNRQNRSFSSHSQRSTQAVSCLERLPPPGRDSYKPPCCCVQPGLSLVNCTQAVCYEPIRTLDVKPCSDITGSSHPCVGPLFCHSFDFVQHHSSQQRSVRAVHLYWKGTPSSITMSQVDGGTFADVRGPWD